VMDKHNLSSQEFLSYIGMLQQNISRMATNSNSCKSMCVAIVAALCAVTNLKGCSLFGVGMIAIAIFCYIDCMYLSLEKSYRDKFNNAVASAKNNAFAEEKLFDMSPGKYDDFKSLKTAFKSWSVWQVYTALTVALIIVSVVKPVTS